MVFVVGACAQNSNPMGKPLPDLSYTHLMPYTPYGGAVELRQSAVLSPQTITTMQSMILSPEMLLKRYAASRFTTKQKAPSLPVRAVFDVQQLSLTKREDGDNMIGILSGAAAEYYTLNLFIALSPVQADGRLNAPYTIKIKRELLLPDNLSLAENEFRQFEFIEKIIQDIDKTLATFIVRMN
jgi:hypothetical protein